ncbi:DUF624 domain-containing protein [Peribacillus muralis]|uniref:YesL family protein n=1 Tax=Peribacillus muralis TaxID=264697 RepID=UPI001F4E4B69|nr:DUF624 domain-containing protein [Peribacillus muralis]MCK1992147.1 DUF624 domain-containing protein [Peribacillus muralis]MCK2012703.1 DUF624 domain-containing protein [Peribacillus muralis]
MRSLHNGLTRICEALMLLTLLNFLWVLFTLGGLIIFGIAPATIALFGVIRKWLKGDLTSGIFRTFFQFYCSEFMKGNKLGLIAAIIGIGLYVDFLLLRNLPTYIQYGLSSLLIIVLIIAVYLFPVYVHYELKSYQYIKLALIFGFSYPIYTLSMIFGTIVLGMMLYLFPVLWPFFSINIISLFLTWQFLRIDAKKGVLLNEDGLG